MKLFTYAACAMMIATFGTGCASTMGDAAKTTGANDASQWQRRKLADGVELVVSPEAGPEAQRVADMIQSEMRSRYIGAR